MASHPILAGLLAATLAVPALAAGPASPPAGYPDELAKWRTGATESLKRERGWLSMVSRDELAPGTYRIGTASDNQVVLPKGLGPAHLGTIEVSRAIWTQSALQFAAEKAARCAAVNTTLCGRRHQVETYALSQMLAPGAAASGRSRATVSW